MLNQVWNFWISVLSKCFNWLFTIKINENPDISLGMLFLGFATVGLAIYFILGSGLIVNTYNSANNLFNKNERKR